MLVRAYVLPDCGPTLVNRTEVSGVMAEPARNHHRIIERRVLDIHPVIHVRLAVETLENKLLLRGHRRTRQERRKVPWLRYLLVS